MTTRPITAQQAHTKLVRLEDDIAHLIARLNASGFKRAAEELGHVTDYCLDAVRDALGDGSEPGDGE
jgi:hypothetical protein